MNAFDQATTKVHAFIAYTQATTERKEAYERYNYASAALQLAQIKERFFQIASQCEPLDSLNPEGNSMAREKQIAAAHFVIFGRMPDTSK